MTTGTAQFRVLGPVELWVDGEQVDLGTAKQRSVLAVLLLSPGQPVGVEALIDRVWGEAPPGHARETLYSYVSRLRRALRGYAVSTGRTDPLRRVGGGYVLDVPVEAVDCHRFRRLTERAGAPGTPEHERRSVLREALDQWRGTPLTGLTGAWFERVRHGLEQQRINAAAEWSELELRTGTPRPVIDRLHELLSEHPLSEALIGQLMRALHHAGRSAEALEHYGSARRGIVAELGAEPGPALRAIHRDVLAATAASPLPEPAPPPWLGLRPHLTRLIGRADESARLAELLDHERLVTVTGTGGCGKTALVLDVAHQQGKPGVAVALAAMTSAEQVVHTLGVLLGRGDTGDDAEDALRAVERILAARTHLLVLDNCEHLATDVADLVVRLLGNCPGLSILATSRQPLSVPGETMFTLEPLRVPEQGGQTGQALLSVPAVALFVERVRQAAPSVTIADEDLEHVAELCRRLDGLPLALELVAARARTFPLRELVDRLGHNLTLLFRTTASSGSRHRTLDATLDWSFQLLSPDEQRLFARMSVFAGGFTMADAEAVCGFAPLGSDRVAVLLAALVDRCLVRPYDSDGTRRYRLLEVIRTFAGTRLADLGERTTTERHHLGRWLGLAREIDRLPRYHQRVLRWLALAPDVANLRKALEFGFGGDGALDSAEIIALTFEFWLVNNGYVAEGRGWLEQALALPNVVARPEVHALLRFHSALLARFYGDNLRGLTIMRPVVGVLGRHRPREYLEAQACLLSGAHMALDPSVLDEVEPTVAAALASTEDDDVLTVINAAGTVLTTWGRFERALALSAEYDRRGVALANSSMAAQLTVKIEATLGRGDLAGAEVLIDELVGLLGDISHAAEQNDPRRVIALSYLVGGQPDRARSLLSEAWTSLRATHAPLTPRFVYLRILLAEAQRRCGQVMAALLTLRDGLTAAAAGTAFQQSLPGVLGAALIAADLGDDESSRLLATQWDTLRQGLGLPLPIGFAEAAGLGLAGSPAGPTTRWNPDALAACVASARVWCERRLPDGRRRYVASG